MRRFILTGTPGAGKTAVLRQLQIEGFGVVEEAATDIIALEQAEGVAEPWLKPDFIDKVVKLQRARAVRGESLPEQVQFHDRSPVCTAALAPVPRLSDVRRIVTRASTSRKGTALRTAGLLHPLAGVRHADGRPANQPGGGAPF
jgi:predicted ATPase